MRVNYLGKKIRLALKKASTIEDVLDITRLLITQIKIEDPKAKIGYVSGKVTADGKDRIPHNLKRMHKFTRKLKEIHGEQIFSAADIFSDIVYWKINLPRPIHEKDFYNFWRKIVSSGVTDIYMTPEWERSHGAKDEHKIAKTLNINIHYIVFEETGIELQIEPKVRRR